MDQNENTGHRGFLPHNINKATPHPHPDALSITALVKESGRIIGYELSNGRRVTREQGVDMAKQNQIKGVAVAEKMGTEYLRGLPDGQEGNNLGNLPSITE